MGKTIDDESIIDTNSFEVHHKIAEVCQSHPQNSPQRHGSLIVEVPSPDESACLRVICDIPGA